MKRFLTLFILPWTVLTILCSVAAKLFLPVDEALGAPVAFGIMLAAVAPPVLLALVISGSPATRSQVLLGGSMVKILTIGFLVWLVRRSQWSFADKNSFLVWLFLSFLLTSSLGWIVVAVRAPSGGESGGTVPR